MPDLVSMRELSRRAGVTLRAIQLAVKAGRIAPIKTEQHGKNPRHFFDPDQAVADFVATRNEARKGTATRAEAGKGPQPDYKGPKDKERDRARIQAPAATPPGPADPRKLNLFGMGDAAEAPATAQETADGRAPVFLNPATKKLHEHRATREEYNAKMAALKFKTETKELIAAAPVKILFFEMGQRVQKNMLSIPARVSALLAAENNERKVYDLLIDEITQALESMSNQELEEILEQ